MFIIKYVDEFGHMYLDIIDIPNTRFYLCYERNNATILDKEGVDYFSKYLKTTTI